MIIDRIENAGLYRGLGHQLEMALKAARIPREPGRYDLNGDTLFALVQQYQTKPLADGKWEAHRKYIDVQYVEKGIERIGWAPVGTLDVTEPYDEGRDIAFYNGSGDFVTVRAGTFVILFPNDAHMPGITVDTPSPVKKVVVKVRVF